MSKRADNNYSSNESYTEASEDLANQEVESKSLDIEDDNRFKDMNELYEKIILNQ